MATLLDESIGSRGFGGLGIGGGDGLGGGLLLGLLLGRGNLLGNNNCNPDGVSPAAAAFDATLLNTVNSIAASIPTTGLENQNAILGAIAAQSLAVQQGFANTKDAVQNLGFANLAAISNVNQNVLTTGLQTQIAIGNDGDKTRELINGNYIADLNRQLTVAQSALLEERSTSRMRDVEVNVAQTVNQTNLQAQAQLQQQQQAQFMAGILAEVRNLAGDIQAVKQGQVIFNSGNMAASGTQAAANTKVA